VTHPFDRAFSSLTPAEFLGLVRDRRDLSALVMTPESAFGRDRAGTAAAVARLGTELGFEVLQQPPLEIGRGRISSTRIREHIEAGRLREAGRLLGRPYAVVGEIVQGDRRGRELGYPTANFRFPAPVALPPNGVYAARVGWGDDSLLHPARTADGVASLGVRPTFGEGSRLLEAHLFDIDEDLYGQRMRLEFVRRQRGEQRFRDAGSLVTQMHRDAARARTLLGERSSARAGTLPRL
jgi:riboflavin kinase/FMN adenylyltransferase